MKNIRIGIICPSEIAFRRFLPSLQKEDGFTYMGVAVLILLNGMARLLMR